MTNPAPPPLGDYVSAGLVGQLVDPGRSQGLPAPQLLAEAGINPEQIANPDGWLPASTVERLVHATMRASGNSLLGLTLAHRTAPAAFGVLGYMAQTCGNLQDALHMINRYERLVSDIGFTTLYHEPGAALWRWDCKTGDVEFLRQATEYILATFASLARMIRFPDSPTLLAVRLRHAPPADPNLLGRYEAAFHCPVHFNQGESALVLSPVALNRPLSNANAGLHQALEHHASRLLQQRKTMQSLRDQAKAQLALQLRQGTASRELLAEQLGMSSRSLHRKLQEDGINYRDLLDELRHEQACHLLQGRQLSIEVIAQRLGFQESQSFSRWFRRLAGCTPGEYQRAAPGQAGA